MSTTENGWTKTLPEQQGWYWVRSGTLGPPVAVEFFPVFMGRRKPGVRYPGKNGFMVAVAEDAAAEWLGPIFPSDFEELAALQKAASDFVDAYKGKEHHLGNGQALKSYLRFRELAQGEKS